MNALDIIILIILAFSIIKGLLQGFLKGISSLVAILAGLFLAKRYYLPASAMLVKFHIPDPKGLTGYLSRREADRKVRAAGVLPVALGVLRGD